MADEKGETFHLEVLLAAEVVASLKIVFQVSLCICGNHQETFDNNDLVFVLCVRSVEVLGWKLWLHHYLFVSEF